MFNKRPLNPVRNPELTCPAHAGYEAVSRLIESKRAAAGKQRLVVAIDGTHGAAFDRLQAALRQFFANEQIVIESTLSYVKTEKQLREQFHANITENRAFGYKTEAGMDSYFQPGAREAIANLIKQRAEAHLIIIIGTGAHWISNGHIDICFFADISRELQQKKHKQGMSNFGILAKLDNVEKYKISYFVEWPILETYRKLRLMEMDYYIDMNDEDHPTTVSVADLVELIKDISLHPLRVKPFFASGVWGGQYLKQIAGLPKEMSNCAWGFEPIAPENSILIAHKDAVMEIPFLLVMTVGYREILGQRIVELFHDYFPIRLDYLDTIEGSNLSCQVHGKRDYLRKHFNEFMEQQESYYIMEKSADSKVYLGFTEASEKEAFLSAVRTSEATDTEFDFTLHVQEWNCHKGDLFLIPTGTVHCSGKNNLVLEISSTTWWFTFKIYDYARKDSDGKPRPINIDMAAENIDFAKKTDWVKRNLIPEPQLVREQGENQEFLLGKRDDLMFIVHRIHLHDEYFDDTNGEFMILNLVEGEKIRLISCEDESIYVDLNYAESYILPSLFGPFKAVNMGSQPCKIIKAGISPDWNERLVDERI